VLIGDTTAAKDNIMVSCDGLQTQLSYTRDEVIAALEVLKSSLSDWLGDVESSMVKTT
jgi:hypothetical protein